MKDNTVSALIVGGLIGGAILLNGSIANSGRTGNQREINEVRMIRSGSAEEMEMEMMGSWADVVEFGGSFEFDGSLSELENLDLEGLDEEIQKTIKNALAREGSIGQGGQIKIRIKNVHDTVAGTSNR